MQDPRLTDDQVRDLFSAYHDRELPPPEHDAVRTALEANPELQGEYDGFCRMLAAMTGLAFDSTDTPGTALPGSVPGSVPGGSLASPRVDILQGVHRKLYKRSGGRLFGDQWSRTVGILPLEVLAIVVLVGLLLVYLAMTQISVRPAGHATDGALVPSATPAR